MDNEQVNPQDDHLLEEIDVETLCKRTGVEVLQFHQDEIYADNECSELVQLKKDRG